MNVEDVQPVILAGGRGTRIAHLLPDLPKPMAPAAGRPFIEWIVRHLAHCGFRDILISTGYKFQAIEHHFARQPVADVQVRCVREKSPLGTADALFNVMQNVDASPAAWLVLNGDTLAFFDWPAFSRRLSEARADAVLLARYVPDATRFGRLFVDDDGIIQRFEEKNPRVVEGGLVNAGVYLLRHDVVSHQLPRLPCSFEMDIFPSLIAAGRRLATYKAAGEFLDIGVAETLAQAGPFVEAHKEYFR